MKVSFATLDPLGIAAAPLSSYGTRLGTPNVSHFTVVSTNLTFVADRDGILSYLIQPSNVIPPAVDDLSVLENTVAFTAASGGSISITGLDSGTYKIYYAAADKNGNNSAVVLGSSEFTK